MPMAAVFSNLESYRGSVWQDLQEPTIQYGVDLAKSQDWTVIIGLDDTGVVTQFERWQGIPWSEPSFGLTKTSAIYRLLSTQPA